MTGYPLPWTDSLPEEFSRRTGRDLLDLLPYLIEEGGDMGREVRLDYYKVIAQLYEEAFFLQISRWCDENNLLLTGHTEEHLPAHPRRQGNFFDTIRHLQIPGADCHDYRYRFPRKITYIEPKYSVSVARAYNKGRAMSEAMGGAGWGCSLQEYKRGINTMAAMGISMFTLHGFYYECEHQGSQADWPASFFYQNPYWKYFKHFADYISRVCLVNSTGRTVVEIGLYYPIEDIQANTLIGELNQQGRVLNKAFHEALTVLLENQIDVDLIDRRSIMSAVLDDGIIKAGQQQFRMLLIPDPMMPDAGLNDQLERFIASGGKIIRYKAGDSDSVEPEKLISAVAEVFTPDIQVIDGSRFDLYTCHRIIDGRDWYFVSNSSSRPRTVTLRLRTPFIGGLEKNSPDNGDVTIIPAKAVNGGTEVYLRLDADEACYLVPCDTAVPAAWEEVNELAVSGRWEFMPLDSSFNDDYSIDALETKLEIPLAFFSSELHPEPIEIRVRNTDWEDGNCGRHLSLWSGRWITRRPSWHCGPFESDLYFRRRVDLPTVPHKASLCVAAVNTFTLYINGHQVIKAESSANPVEVDISAFLRDGENLIAVHVHNETPLRERDLNSVEEFPVDRLISLLLQGEIYLPGQEEPLIIRSDEEWIVSNRSESDWNTPGVIEKAVRVDASSLSSFGSEHLDGVWTYAWERGAPPMLPWRDVPLFGKSVSYPVKLYYGVIIPAGASSIKLPVTAGDSTFRLDGVPVKWTSDVLSIAPTDFARRLDITITASKANDGLLNPIEVTLTPFMTSLSDWRLHGLQWFSGRSLYRNRFKLKEQPGRYILELGKVCFNAEIWINGVLADIRVWEPYRADITEYLRDGENTIAVVVANSAAVERRNMLVDEGQALGWARYWNRDNIDREGENLASGLMGPVRIFKERRGGLLQ